MKPSTNHPFILTTDGSGYTDGIGGWAWRLRREGRILGEAVGSATNINTYQMEYLALIQGMTHFLDNKKQYMKRYNEFGVHPQVHWYTDCESLVTRMTSEDPRSGAIKPYGAAMAEVMKHVIFRPHWVSRDTKWADLQWCDLQASTARVMMVNYCQVD
jgi:ribonuclease HI